MIKYINKINKIWTYIYFDTWDKAYASVSSKGENYLRRSLSPYCYHR